MTSQLAKKHIEPSFIWGFANNWFKQDIAPDPRPVTATLSSNVMHLRERAAN